MQKSSQIKKQVRLRNEHHEASISCSNELQIKKKIKFYERSSIEASISCSNELQNNEQEASISCSNELQVKRRVKNSIDF